MNQPPSENVETRTPPRKLSVALCIGFCLLIGSVPSIQLIEDLSGSRPIRAAALVRDVKRAVEDVPADGSAWSQTMACNDAVQEALADHDQSLAWDSAPRWISHRTLGRWASGWLQYHDGRAVVGRDGWLYHRPDLDWVIGRGFLTEESSDPRRAVQVFHRALQQQDIRLILLPVPVKPTVHPEGLANARVAVTNVDWTAFKRWALAQNIDLFDPAPLLYKRASRQPQYLKTDTHWRPEAMTEVARQLARRVTPWIHDGASESTHHRIRPMRIENLGDTGRALPVGHFEPEQVRIEQVLAEDGSAWSSNETSGVVLLGDSFANIYSDPSMRWGGSAGLAEQLSRFLSQDIHALVINGGGASESRRLFVQEMRRNPSRAREIKVVVWQFSTRDLAQAEWDMIHWPK